MLKIMTDENSLVTLEMKDLVHCIMGYCISHLAFQAELNFFKDQKHVQTMLFYTVVALHCFIGVQLICNYKYMSRQ